MDSSRRLIFQGLAAGLALLISFSAGAQTIPRPPQFVLLGYDGSKDNSMWERTRKFARETGAKLTYFVSGVYFLTEANKMQYHPPAGKSAGHSDIGFGGSQADLEQRLKEVMQAKQEGNEMASHVNGHFDGSQWSYADWAQEFSEFDRLMLNVHQNNHLDAAGSQAWQEALKNSMIGFRAPLLGTSSGMYQVLQEKKYSYDTSQTSAPSDWPRKSKYGYWDFPLATLIIAGTAKHTLSMDYNFYYADSAGQPDADPAHIKLFEDRMYQTYINYFTKNYSGNRAPVHIGHHFSMWNGGAYLRAFEHFGRTVCGLAEVKCVAYEELTQFMNQQNSATLSQWQAGQFENQHMHIATLRLS